MVSLFRDLKSGGRKFTSFASNVIAIVVGLTLGFMIDEWRAEKSQFESEASIIKSIKADLEADIVFANRTISRLKKHSNDLRNLLDVQARRSLSPDSLSRYMFVLSHASDEFAGNDHTYQTIPADMRNIISNKALRRALQFYYSVYYNAARSVVEEAERLRHSRAKLLRRDVKTLGVKILEPFYVADKMHIVHFDATSVDEFFEVEEFKSEVHWALQWTEFSRYIHEERIMEINRIISLINE